jgi:hypothetical protein
MPVVPEGSRHATININGIDGGQPVDDTPSPCVADRCRVVFDRRFLMEEGSSARAPRSPRWSPRRSRACPTCSSRSRIG